MNLYKELPDIETTIHASEPAELLQSMDDFHKMFKDYYDDPYRIDLATMRSYG